MRTHDHLPSRRDVVAAGNVFEAVGDVDRQADDMFDARAVLGEDGEDVLQRLAELLLEMAGLDRTARRCR